MITVCIVHPNGNRQEVILSGVPRVGEGIRLKNGRDSMSSLMVEYVMWEEGANGREPTVLASVRQRKNEPPI